MSLTPRATKGSPLTNSEIDAAFNGLDAAVNTAQTTANTANTAAGSASTAAAAAQTTANAAQTTATAKPSLQQGTLVASTAEAAAPTNVINYVAAAVAALKGGVASGGDTLAKLFASMNNDPALNTTLRALITAASNAASAAQGDATAALSALAGKVDKYTPVDLGTGSTVNLTYGSHINRSLQWHGSGGSNTIHLDATGAIQGDYYEISHNGSGTFTVTGATAPTGYKNTVNPGEIYLAEFQNGTFVSQLISPGGGGTDLVTVAGATPIGSTLTATVAPGWVGTLQWYWQDTGADISGATSSTYQTVAGDAGHNVGVRFKSTAGTVLYTSNYIQASLTLPGQPTGLSLGPATTTTIPYSFSAPTTGGAPTSYKPQYRTPPGSGSWTDWGGHSGTSLSGTITGVNPNTQYQVQVLAHNAAGDGTPSSPATITTASTKITFGPDPFTSNTLDSRYAGFTSGWVSNGGPSGGKLVYSSGTTWGVLPFDLTPGVDYNISVDLDDNGQVQGTPMILIDGGGGNYLWVGRNDGLLTNGAFEMRCFLGGTEVTGNYQADTVFRGGTGANASRIAVDLHWDSGTQCTVTFTSTGGLNPGSFQKVMTGIGAIKSATTWQGSIEQLNGKPMYWDNLTVA